MDDTDETRMVIPMRDPMVHDLHMRVSELERNTNSHTTEVAVLKTDLTYVKASVDDVKVSVGNINKGITRILWAIGLSVLTAATTFVMTGGLTVIQQ